MNLTGRGMGAHPRARTEAAIRLADPAGLNAAAEWFDERWDEAHDRKADLLRELRRITKPQSGETLYLKILLETYRRCSTSRCRS